ncbi:imidazole glycerol phosphate synthase, glutamine amidotransferase subunit [Bellilinea caldifistulae]|nr:imidazole glycerol phosphate synthase subunit HisH [Bellilinea caldifistulae]GAP10420.1 imidazole glycerol phosphate synthase, glutamine amidotransferase subunit [Bellilinea caldifistulae]
MSDPMVVVDAGTGNLRSVVGALTKIGASVRLTRDPEDVLRAERIILPGVGAFGEFMQGLTRNHLDEALKNFIQSGRPLLGICVGMQALMEISEELGSYQGLSLFKGPVRKFPSMPAYKVPHTGWNQVWIRRDSPLTRGLTSGFYAYFNHSYYCQPHQNEFVLATTDYTLDFCSMIGQGVLFGVQFHPEKSQAVGEILLNNFVNL